MRPLELPVRLSELSMRPFELPIPAFYPALGLIEHPLKIRHGAADEARVQLEERPQLPRYLENDVVPESWQIGLLRAGWHLGEERSPDPHAYQHEQYISFQSRLRTKPSISTHQMYLDTGVPLPARLKIWRRAGTSGRSKEWAAC
jgi:hypothetical protein